MNTKRVVVFGWLAMGTAVGLIIIAAVLPSGPNQLLRLLGVLCVLAAPALFVPPFLYLARWRDQKNDRTYMETTAVVHQGPYRLVRHPQYLGYMLLCLGFALIKQQGLVILLSVVAVGLFLQLALAEEAELKYRFGDSYAEYCRQVPRFNVLLGLIRHWRRRIAGR